jgi:hypothetical protein
MLALMVAILDGSPVPRSIVFSFTSLGGVMNEADFFVEISSSCGESFFEAVAKRGA